ncbi:hypothetical protein AB4099_07025 [Bosea sp. 2KB_26]|uniref:hypothetical protein n=1 Tax=Bosea sp. 2KB_26 TaxID=3237475 RepID=UPI003F912F3F
MTAVTELKPETPSVCITCHEDYRYALLRIGQIEDAQANSAKARELQALRAAIVDYEMRKASRTKGPEVTVAK